MKGKALIVSLALAAIPLPAALAAPGGVPGPPAAHPGKATTPAAHPVAFVARGVATSINAGGGSFVIEVKGGNRFLRRAIAGLPSPQALSVKVDAETATDAFTTKITKAAKGPCGLLGRGRPRPRRGDMESAAGHIARRPAGPRGTPRGRRRRRADALTP
jgi:hypothetical protein